VLDSYTQLKRIDGHQICKKQMQGLAQKSPQPEAIWSQKRVGADSLRRCNCANTTTGEGKGRTRVKMLRNRISNRPKRKNQPGLILRLIKIPAEILLVVMLTSISFDILTI
jgi:hypothetical protein